MMMMTPPTHYTTARVGCYVLLGLVCLPLHGVAAKSDSSHKAKQDSCCAKVRNVMATVGRDNLTLSTRSSSENGIYRHASEAYKLIQGL